MSKNSEKILFDREFQLNYSHYVCEKHKPLSLSAMQSGVVSEEQQALDKLG